MNSWESLGLPAATVVLTTGNWTRDVLVTTLFLEIEWGGPVGQRDPRGALGPPGQPCSAMWSEEQGKPVCGRRKSEAEP